MLLPFYLSPVALCKPLNQATFEICAVKPT